MKNIIPAGIVKVSRKNQIVIPKAVRNVLKLKPHDAMLMIAYKDEVRLMRKPKDWVRYVRGLGKEVWESLGGGDAYLEKERASWE